ncbi:hypothetical protein LINPERHAP1_LOCUS23040 [Linum perenne]
MGGFTLLVQLWVLERFSRIVEHYIEQGPPPADDSVLRGLCWIPSIICHQKAMRLDEIRYALDRCTEFLWMSYACHTKEYDVEVDPLWRSVTPILCIGCIPWHHPDRCVPQDAEPATHVEQLLAANFRASVQDWVVRYQEYLIL